MLELQLSGYASILFLFRNGAEWGQIEGIA